MDNQIVTGAFLTCQDQSGHTAVELDALLLSRLLIIRPVPPREPGDDSGPLWRRLAWFIGLAVAASSLTALVAYALRALPFAG